MGEIRLVHMGDVVKRLRMSMGISQQELAELSSLSQKSIQLIEGNSQEPRLNTLYRLANALGMEFVDFMSQVHQHCSTQEYTSEISS
jgi:transcriptional regulator with XRE-family HTH domain